MRQLCASLHAERRWRGRRAGHLSGQLLGLPLALLLSLSFQTNRAREVRSVTDHSEVRGARVRPGGLGQAVELTTANAVADGIGRARDFLLASWTFRSAHRAGSPGRLLLFSLSITSITSIIK